ncbi:aminotransferase class V-fold PLP-dependent enzyme [Aeromicrobium sp. CnD17-E]|uniref:kynureninase n=1 Tax=Aeromicrobium sp. CnD17-E TaxID=2954487 RepID=UPI002096B94F|nr:aminotransferase class V-fold PLP-dependent enzyme [Aeromicrobium sp. CnD17-E]MCO7240238.1 aminotransferase class V-fold PLP-dependent enzyme [Aeromicrobium sp. CnD17-E]
MSDFRERAAALDAADPLAAWRQQFQLDADVVAYLDGNSLGRLPLRTRERLATFVREEWGARLIRGWSEGWVELPVLVGDEVGALLGAAAGQTVVGDSTSIGIAKALHAAVSLAPGRTRLVVDAGDFPTDRYLAEQVARQRGLELVVVHRDAEGDVAASLADVLDERTAVVLLSHVDYRTGVLLDLPSLTAEVHAAGALVAWDLCHSAGVVPTSLDAAEVDLAVGCTYKYLNGGPGAPAFLYAAARHLPHLEQPLPGWWSADDLFAMAEEYRPATDARRLLSGTPNVAGLVAVREGVAMVAEAGVEAARTKSELLTAFTVDALDALGERGIALELVTPREPDRRGSHVTVRVPDARTLTARLTERGVVPDFREPDLLRLGLAPLTTSFAELHAGLSVLAEELAH